MSWSKTIYRRLPFWMRKNFSKSQAFIFIICLAATLFGLVFFEIITLSFGSLPQNDSFEDVKSEPPLVNRVRSTTRSSTTTSKPSVIKRRPVLAKMHGVLSSSLPLYRPDSNGYFRCVKSGDLILFDRVNDDYCDCPEDGSDEPSTNACRKGIFHCNGNEEGIPSNRVNDGICDCCDGSDEWQEIRILPVMSDELQRKLGRFQPPCPDQC